jgi:hypothetical protein
MRALRDTWLHYLADNLPGVKVNPLRRSSTNEGLDTPQANAVNVQFLKDDLAITGTKTSVLIDILNDDENACLDMVQQVWHLLNVTGSIPKLDYTSGSPTPLGNNISWDSTKIQFRYVYSAFYFRYSCLLALTHTPTL